jgi:hypothetical protein
MSQQPQVLVQEEHTFERETVNNRKRKRDPIAFLHAEQALVQIMGMQCLVHPENDKSDCDACWCRSICFNYFLIYLQMNKRIFFKGFGPNFTPVKETRVFYGPRTYEQFLWFGCRF